MGQFMTIHFIFFVDSSRVPKNSQILKTNSHHYCRESRVSPCGPYGCSIRRVLQFVVKTELTKLVMFQQANVEDAMCRHGHDGIPQQS